MKENKLLQFLLDKKSKGLEMNLGEAMSKCDIWAPNDGISSNRISLENIGKKIISKGNETLSYLAIFIIN